MLCEICGKKNATVHLTEIVEEEMMELHLCDKCAQAKGAHIQQPFSLSDLLGGLVGLDKEPAEEKETSLKCSNCGLSYEDFKRSGKLGCGRCYDIFKEVLLPVLRRIHGLSKHTGRVPAKTGVKVKYVRHMQDLQNDLQKSIEMEEFENAAKIRDQIKKAQKDENGKVRVEKNNDNKGK